ncbi:hypothetical protein V6N12_050617 [Hibiscus sabdariffa]|uniref:Uncharacterized protein n=1 Tax=Hibiscus sabdariffa TaxID=183260 RepID=A0ABR2GD36_9ROSI
MAVGSGDGGAVVGWLRFGPTSGMDWVKSPPGVWLLWGGHVVAAECTVGDHTALPVPQETMGQADGAGI